MKYIFAVLIITASSLTGLKSGNRLTVRKRKLQQIISFLSVLKSEIEYSESSVLEFLRQENSIGSYNELGFIGKCVELSEQYDFPSAFVISVTSEEKLLHKREKDLLCSFGKRIGTGNVISQVRLIDYTILRFENFLKEAVLKEQNEKKLRIILGISSGLFICCLLL